MAESRETIHSGHFMTSNPHSEAVPDDGDEDVEVDVVEDDDKGGDCKMGGSVKDEKPVTFYKFGPQKTQSIAIDVSLNKLNKCIKVAYNKMTTPKWKDFKGLRLHWKQRIRLNNVIWRAYHMEFGVPRRKKRTPYCYFTVPDDDTTHAKIEVGGYNQGSVLEGMYWKRRMAAVCAQYKRWRHYSKKHPYMAVRKAGREPPLILSRKRPHSGSGLPQSSVFPSLEPPPKSQTPKNTSTEYFDIDEFENEFTDTLFDSLKEPYIFPNPKEMMQSGNADIMQPGLLSLQPSLEEIMASLIGEDQPGGSGEMIPHSLASSSFPPRISSLSPFPSSRSSHSSHHNSSQGPADYSAKDYQAASMLIQYSEQKSRLSMVPPPAVLPQSSASTPFSSPSDYHSWKAPGANSNFLMPGGEQMPGSSDYVPQFLSASRSSAAPFRPLGASPGVAFGVIPPSSRCWFESAGLGGSGAGSLQAPPPSAPPLDCNSKHSLSGIPSLRTTPPLVQKSSSSSGCLPQQTLMERLGRRGGASATSSHWPDASSTSSSSSSLAFPLPSQPLSAPVQRSSKNPWDGEDPSNSRHPFASSEDSDKEEMKAVKEEMATPCPGPPPAKQRRTKQVPADSTLHPTERKRILHLHAEQSRRLALKDGFDQLLNYLPDVHSAGMKPTNAVVLARAAEHIKELRERKSEAQRKAQQLSNTIQLLNERISSVQTALPASKKHSEGAGGSQPSALQQFFERYSKERAKQEWPFWLMARLLQPVVDSLACSLKDVSDGSPDQLASAVRSWLASNWHVAKLRPLASEVLVYLATSTRILTQPDTLRRHVEENISK